MTRDPPLGLTLGYFHHFIALHGGRSTFEGLSTAQVCDEFVKRDTHSTHLSLVEHVGLQHESAAYVQPATWFVSHAWSYLFVDVVDALDNFFIELGLESRDVAVWFCMFNNNQHDIMGHTRDFQFWVDSFESALTAIGNVVMVLSPWNNPTTLTRTWCVFEIYVAIVTKARFEVAMGKPQKEAFLKDIQNGESAFYHMLATIKSENSQTAVPSDRDNIFDTLKRSNLGFAALDRLLLNELEAWMLRTVQSKIEATELAAQAHWLWVKSELLYVANAFEDAQTTCEQAIRIYRDELKSSDPAMWSAVVTAAAMAGRRNQPRHVWEPMFKEALANQIAIFGQEHETTVHTMLVLGQRYNQTGEFSLGMALLKNCFEIRCRQLGETHEKTLYAVNSIGSCYSNQNKLKEAEEWHRRCFTLRQRTLGDAHPNTILSASNLATCYTKQGQYALAFSILQESFAVNQRILGTDHESTLNNYNKLGQLLTVQGRHEEAEQILIECVDTSSRLQLRPRVALLCTVVFDVCVLINDVIYVDIVRLGMNYLGQGNLNKAHIHLNQAFQGFTATFGPTHFESQRALYWLYLWTRSSNGWNSMADIVQFESWLKDAQCFHETWTRFPCHGCYQLIRGIFFTCSNCPKFAWFFCGACVTANVPATFCDHGQAAFMGLKPPARDLQETRLNLLKQETNWVEYEKHRQVYEKYCAEFQVPVNEVT
ncbi:Aste57867_9869 [Aphanomyces stellatus]|uniref:Aste57867_9869 protein n=1 Tax=Aphanomyces stellatus TaxID=120398 RepID=A0A485KP98_9STRA|nr:hypothetical protein As57867_009830 [Aphanomyces stellatus]VFT86748.1 Aste57867_9869 [Aphanomyces stellatus]